MQAHLLWLRSYLELLPGECDCIHVQQLPAPHSNTVSGVQQMATCCSAPFRNPSMAGGTSQLDLNVCGEGTGTSQDSMQE